MPELNYDKLFQSTDELPEPELAHINGHIPEWLHGTLIRVGPGRFDFPNFTMNHWLDGYCILSKFEIHGGSGGSVKFHEKFLQSDVYKKATRVHKPVLCEFGTRGFPDPSKSIFSRLISSVIPIELSDNDQLSLFRLGSETFSTSETNYFRSFDLETLETGEKLDTNKLFGTNICSAHPLTDSATGITYNFGATCLTGPKYHVVKIPSPKSHPTSSAKDLMKKSKILCSIPSSWIGMMSYFHSFGMTSKYLICIEQPYVMNITKAVYSVIKGRGGYCFKDWLDWKPEYKNKFIIIEKETGKVSKMEYISEHAFFFLHFINCYEDDNHQLVLDLFAYSNPTFLEDGMLLAKLREPCRRARGEDCHEYAFASAQRFVLPLISPDDLAQLPEGVNLVEMKSDARAVRSKTASQIIITPEILTKPGLEFPRINPHHAGKKYFYFYAAGSTTCGHFQNSLCKMNCKSKQCSVWRAGTNYFPGEPIFVPRPSSSGRDLNNNWEYNSSGDRDGDEDDGVIISAVSDIKHNANDFLLFLDAKTMKELGRASFKAHVPQAIHGLFVTTTETDGTF